MSESRKDVLLKALEAEVGVEPVDLGTPVYRRRRRVVAVRECVRADGGRRARCPGCRLAVLGSQ